jgi:hypothetical protein
MPELELIARVPSRDRTRKRLLTCLVKAGKF